MIANMHYYVEATFGGNDHLVIYGHTENVWVAKQYCKAILKNKFFLESHSSPDEAATFVEFVAFQGTTVQFHNAIKEDYGVTIDGEDYIDVFETGIVSGNKVSLAPKAKVLATVADVMNGRFVSFAERFLLPYDIKNLIKSIDAVRIFLAFVRTSFLSPKERQLIQDFIAILQAHPLIAENKFPFFLDTMFTDDAFIDIIQYGIIKRWYVPI